VVADGWWAALVSAPATIVPGATAGSCPARRDDGPVQGNQDLDGLVADLTRKGYSPSQIRAVAAGWDAACHEGAHRDLAEAVHAAADDLEIRRLMSRDAGPAGDRSGD
jgi:hypothetical protein